MMSLRDKDGPLYSTKQELGDSTKLSAAASSSSSRQWSSGFKNPRIVRVSRTFGGKDRHSKVCTIKGLRDRRIRLSVPTAIQLYDLQDRLGLSQPSKVIDWLLDTTKHDIDKLPPLPVIPGSFNPSQGYGVPSLSSSTPFFDASLLPSRKECGININSTSTEDVDVDEEDDSIVAKLKYWDSSAMMRSKQKCVDHQHDQGTTSQVLAQNLFPIASSNSTNILPLHHNTPTFLSNNPMFNYYHLEPSNLSLSQLGSLGLPSSHGDHHQGSSQSSSAPQQPPSSLSLSSMSQLFLCPSMTTTSFFPPHHHASFMNNSHHHPHQVENDLRQFNRFPMSSNNPFSSSFHNNSSGLDMKLAFPLSMNHDPHLQQQSNDESRQGKSSRGLNPWKEPSGN